MRVLIFSTAYLPFIGGAEIAVKEITGRMKGFEFDLITARLDKKCPAEERIGAVNIYRIGKGGKIDKFLLPILGLFKALRLNRKNDYKIIWSIMASQAGITASFFKLIFRAKKLVLTLQEGDDEEHLKRYTFGNELLFKIFVQPFHRLAIKNADFITAISNALKNRAKLSGARCAIEVVPNGVNIEKFEKKESQFSPDESDKSLKDRLGILKDEKVITTVSRLAKKNGLEDLIRAAKLLTEAADAKETEYKLLIIGTGGLEKSLKSLVRELKLEGKVIFIGGIPNDEVPEYLWISDVFIRPSLSEGLGNVFLEAMAAGVPVVATPVGGIKDFLVDEANGLFCEAGNPASIKEKIKILLDNIPLKTKLIAGGKKTVKEGYDCNQVAQKMEEIFRGFIK